MDRLSLLFPVLSSLAVQPCAGQLPEHPPGFSVETLHSSSERQAVFGTRGFAVDPQADWLYLALGNTIHRVDSFGHGELLVDLGTSNEIGLLVRPPGSPEVFYTSLTSGTTYGRDLSSGQTRTLQGPGFAFDLALTGNGGILVSANPSWPNDPDGGIWLVDPGGVTREVVHLTGPSGPLLVDPAGNLLYATQSTAFPPPPGSTRILRFPGPALARALAGGAPLTETDGETVLANLDPVYDMVMDDRARLLMSELGSGTVRRTRPGTFVLDPVPAIRVAGAALQLEFHAGSTGLFAAYQPEHGGALHLLSSNWSDRMEVHRVEPLRPTVISSPSARIGPGPVDLFVQGGPGFGQGWLLASFVPGHTEMPLFTLDGIPLWVSLSLSSPLFTVSLPLDGLGNGSIRLLHPGGFEAEVRFQAVTRGVDAGGAVVWGTTSLYPLVLDR